MNLILPKGAFIVQRQEAEKKSAIIGAKEEKLNVGTILFTHADLRVYEGYKVVFRESFSEEIKINGIDLLFFRDLDSSIYYVTQD